MRCDESCCDGATTTATIVDECLWLVTRTKAMKRAKVELQNPLVQPRRLRVRTTAGRSARIRARDDRFGISAQSRVPAEDAIGRRVLPRPQARTSDAGYALSARIPAPTMALATGAHLGPYEIHSALGAGGMGEVYRATDTKLGRAVALKILPDAFAADPDRVSRFQREAKTLASLNHPNIGGIYGLAEASGVTALVLELVEGPTLADRIAQGPIALDEALPIAQQIAAAL